MFSHVVIFWTRPEIPDSTAQLLAGAEKYLRPSPGVLSFHIGCMSPSDRPVVDQSYQVALNLVFPSKAAEKRLPQRRRPERLCGPCGWRRQSDDSRDFPADPCGGGGGALRQLDFAAGLVAGRHAPDDRRDPLFRRHHPAHPHWRHSHAHGRSHRRGDADRGLVVGGGGGVCGATRRPLDA